MIRLLYLVQAVLAAWTIGSPFALGYGASTSVIAAVALGCLVLILAVAGAVTERTPLGAVVAVIGVLTALWGIVGLVVPALSGGGSELVVGLLWAVLGCFVALIRPKLAVSAYDVHGNTLANIRTVGMKKSGDLSAKATLLGAMPSTMYFRPDEVWKLLGLLDWDTVRHLPAFLVKGALAVRQQEGKEGNRESVPKSSTRAGSVKS